MIVPLKQLSSLTPYPSAALQGRARLKWAVERMVKMFRPICSLLLLSLLLAPAAHAASRLIDDFEQGLAPAWEVKSFKGTTDYQVVAEGTGKVLRAESRGTASGLVYPLDYRLDDYPYLSWRWKIARTIAAGDETRKSGDDYAARVYVIFPYWFFPKTKSINYIWANRLQQGDALPNPFTGNAIMLAVESGPEKVGQWLTERRNVVEDYRRLFGGEPPSRMVVAIMSDTDNTGTTAVAWYDDIAVSR